jgi:transcription elongation GreA/GreB family factor
MKAQIFNHLQELLQKRIEENKLDIADIKDARDDETKSSMGDKHETARAMAQQELDRLEGQLMVSLMLKKELDQLNPKHACTKVEPGSLVITEQGIYYISIGLGKIEVEGKDYYAISLASPMGQALLDKETGNVVTFMEKDIKITEIA